MVVSGEWALLNPPLFPPRAAPDIPPQRPTSAESNRVNQMTEPVQRHGPKRKKEIGGVAKGGFPNRGIPGPVRRKKERKRGME